MNFQSDCLYLSIQFTDVVVGHVGNSCLFFEKMLAEEGDTIDSWDSNIPFQPNSSLHERYPDIGSSMFWKQLRLFSGIAQIIFIPLPPPIRARWSFYLDAKKYIEAHITESNSHGDDNYGNDDYDVFPNPHLTKNLYRLMLQKRYIAFNRKASFFVVVCFIFFIDLSWLLKVKWTSLSWE